MKLDINSGKDNEFSNIIIKPSFRSNPLAWIWHKLTKHDDYKNENILVAIYGIFIWGLISFYIFYRTIFLPIANIGIDKTPISIEGPFTLSHVHFPGKFGGDRLYIEKENKIWTSVCIGMFDSYCQKGIRKKSFSEDYTIKYVVRYKDETVPARAVVSSIEKKENEKIKVIFKNESLWRFFYLRYLFLLFFIPLLIYSMKTFKNALSRFFDLIHN